MQAVRLRHRLRLVQQGKPNPARSALYPTVAVVRVVGILTPPSNTEGCANSGAAASSSHPGRSRATSAHCAAAEGRRWKRMADELRDLRSCPEIGGVRIRGSNTSSSLPRCVIAAMRCGCKHGGCDNFARARRHDLVQSYPVQDAVVDGVALADQDRARLALGRWQREIRCGDLHVAVDDLDLAGPASTVLAAASAGTGDYAARQRGSSRPRRSRRSRRTARS